LQVESGDTNGTEAVNAIAMKEKGEALALAVQDRRANGVA
jgi:hypothetical protein